MLSGSDKMQLCDNDILSEYSDNDLKDLLKYLDDYLISYRDNLNLSDKCQFGLEIEGSYTGFRDYMLIRGLRHTKKKWRLVEEKSVLFGIEVKSAKLKDNEDTWSDLDSVLDTLINVGVVLTDECGGHIHCDAGILNDDLSLWTNFIKLWILYEDIILRFSFGEYLNARNTMDYYAHEIGNNWRFNDCLNFPNLTFPKYIGFLYLNRYCAVNLSNLAFGNKKKMNTIEFRCPNASLDKVIWQNNVNLFMKLLMCISDGKELHLPEYYVEKQCDDIDLKRALTFSDMIFDNNLDKLNFLKQYLKNNQVYEQSRYAYPTLKKTNRKLTSD